MTKNTAAPASDERRTVVGSWEHLRTSELAERLPAGTRTFRTIESHTAENPTRTVLSGVPDLVGDTMLDRMHDLATNHDWVRTALMFEPRGGSVMSGCVLQAPCDGRADVGVLYIEASGHLPMCGHDTIGLATVLVEAGLVDAVEPVTRIVLDTPAGLVETEVDVCDGRVRSASFVSTPSFLLAADVRVGLSDGTRLTVDIAWGGNFYAIVSAQEAGVDLDSPFVAERIALAATIREAVNATVDVVHPVLHGVRGCTHVMFTGEPRDPRATGRCSVIIRPGGADRSPCGTGTSARSATLVAKGRLGLGEQFVHESITGGLFTATPLERVQVGPFDGVRSRISGQAFVTGTAEWIVDPRDPQRDGFLVL
ncbi:MAG: proline racemase family protein [Actinomycetes bacterium]